MTTLLEQHFGHLVDYEFTALMEDDLDRIADGDEERTAWLRRFYFGDGDDEGLKALVSDIGDIDARAVNTIAIGDGIELRVGRYGPYIERNGERVTIADEIAPDELTVSKAEELLSQASDERELGVNPETGRDGPRQERPLRPVRDRGGRRRREAEDGVALQGDVAGDGDARGRAAAPRASRAWSGSDADGEEVVVSNGRYGPS